MYPSPLLTKVNAFRGKFLQWSIYGVGVIPPEQEHLKWLKRVWLPLFDVLAILAGFRSVSSGIPAIDALLPPELADALCYALVVIAFLCLVGILVPRLAFLEVLAKSALIAIFSCYIIALRILVAEGESARDFVSITVAMAMILPFFRLGILADEKRKREAKKREQESA